MAGGLVSIGELARRAGTVAATVRSWEARHGFPQPVRLASGHRRYREGDVALVAEVVRLRRVGWSVEASVAAAGDAATRSVASFYATLRSGHPELRPQVLTKRILAALTAAMEDEYCARASRPVLYGAFQRDVYYRQSEQRWRELARTAAKAVVFADFDRFRAQLGSPVEVPLAPDSPALREWALVCDAPGYAACVAGWELPERAGAPDGDRHFEVVWTLDPRLVREAASVGAGLAGGSGGGGSGGGGVSGGGSGGGGLFGGSDPAGSLGPAGVPPPASADLRQATALFARALAYAQGRRSSRPG